MSRNFLRERDHSRRDLLRTVASTSLAVVAASGGARTAAATDDADDPEYPSEAWFAREAANYAKQLEAPTEQARDSAFMTRLAEQIVINEFEAKRREQEEPGWDTDGNICSDAYFGPCAGDPYLYPVADLDVGGLADEYTPDDDESLAAFLDVDDVQDVQFDANTGTESLVSGGTTDDTATPAETMDALETALDDVDTVPMWSGNPLYDEAVEFQAVAFYDSGLDQDEGGARLSGRVWVPKHSDSSDELPGVVITCGAMATEAMYWWAATALAAHGYMVLTFDLRGQGRSDNATPGGTTEGLNSQFTNKIDAVDFFTSTDRDGDRYPHNTDEYARADDDAAGVVDYNPYWRRLDRDRIGVAGHSRGASSSCVAQGLDPWPESAKGDENPIEVGVAWDSLRPYEEIAGREVEPRVPMLGMGADYYSRDGFVEQPKTEPPDPDAKIPGFREWRRAGLPVFDFVIRGATHFEWSQGAGLPATSWEHWGNQMAAYYTLAWFDYWLKESGEPGADDADSRLLESEPWHERMSFYYKSAYSFPPANRKRSWRSGGTRKDWHTDEDIRNVGDSSSG